MAIVAADWTVTRSTGDIRYIGADHNGAATYATVIEFHRWLQDLADDASSSGDDELDITDEDPSARSTDNIITLKGNYNIDATASEHLYDGSIIFDGGDEVYDGIVNFGNADVQIQIIQNGAVLSDDWWNEAGVGLNADSAQGISHRFMLPVRTAGADIDGRRLIGTSRTFLNTYSEFSINGTSNGNNVLALSDTNDLNNTTASGTVATWTGITNSNEGYVGIDVDNSNEPLIASLGAIHCITHTIGVDEPLWIVHQPINEVPTGNTNVSITAMIKHVSGINNATVYWREEGESEFNQLSMTIINDDNWSADLMIPSGSESIEYYIEAEANSGKSLSRPLVAPEGFWTFTVANLSNEEWADNNISAPYPNPTSEVVSFKLNQIEGAVEVSIYNIFGQKLNTTTIVEANGILTLDLNKEWEGTLLVTFEGDFGKVTKKIIKL